MKEYLLENPQVVVTLIIGIVGLIITWWYNNNNLKIANQKMEKELFNEFNGRYDKLNDHLKSIDENTTVTDLKIEKYQVDGKLKTLEVILIDYFNLCAEEYYWRKKKRISKKIWLSWEAGMKHYFKIKIVKELWDKEINDFGYEAYYLKDGQSFFGDKVSTQANNDMV